MPEYEVLIRFNDEGSLSPRATAEHVYTNLIAEMFFRSLTLEVKDKKTGKVEVVELESSVEKDESLMRFIALIGVASKFMTEEQKRELEAWERENLDGHSVGTSDWPGWEQIIGRPPKKFRKTAGA